MNKARSTCMVLVVLLAGAGTGQETAKPVIHSTCLVKVPQDNEQMAIVGSLAGTADVAGKAAQEVLGLTVAPAVGWDQVSPGVVRLFTQLPQDASTKASAFWNAVGVHLSKALRRVYEEQVDQVRSQLDMVERQKAEALAGLQGQSAADPSTQAMQEQLDQLVDLSSLNPQMPLQEAIQRIRNSVSPPLRSLVLWNDLANAGIDPRSTPIGLDGVNQVKVETVLRLLLKSVSAGGSDVDYAIDGGVIVIGSDAAETLHKESSAGPEGPLSVDELAKQREATVQSAGGEQLTKLNNELSSLSIQLAELEATLPAIRGQLRQVEAQISQAASAIPQRIERDLAMKSLRQAEERLHDLRQKLANLQAPTVTVIGAGE